MLQMLQIRNLLYLANANVSNDSSGFDRKSFNDFSDLFCLLLFWEKTHLNGDEKWKQQHGPESVA